MLGREIRLARQSLGLSMVVVAGAAGISVATLSRIERGLVPSASLPLLACLCELVGLELTARSYPGGRPIRDARHAALLAKLRSRLHASLAWRTEVPLPIAGDKRAWDGTVSGRDWLYGVEAEMHPIDGQATARRLSLKARDGGANGLILLLPDTQQTRRFRREFGPLLAADFPVSSRTALELLAAGLAPGGNAIVVL